MLISLGILLIAAAITAVIFLTEPEAQREGATRKTAMLVEVVTAEKGDFNPMIVTTGTVIPEREIILSPRINGEVIMVSEKFTPGGYAGKGDVLLRIDPSDYTNTVKMRESELLQAESDLEMEMGRQEVARQDYQMVSDSLSTRNKALLLREPQLKSARARMEAASAALERANLDLNRTTIRAPFDAHIIERNVNTGSQVSPGQNLGRLVGTETYWVEASVPLSMIKWLSFPESAGENGSEVILKGRSSWSEDAYRTGYLFRLIGSLEDQTRLARVLVKVDDPLAMKKQNRGKPEMIIDAFLEARIKAEKVNDIVRLNRDYIRQNGTVWLKKNSKLEIRQLEILLQDAEYAYIESGLDQGDSVVITSLSTVVDGELLRVNESGSPADSLQVTQQRETRTN